MKVRGTRTGNASTRLQALKAARGWSLRNMAVAFGVDTSSAWRWLNGKQEPSGSVIALLERMEADPSHAENVEPRTRLRKWADARGFGVAELAKVFDVNPEKVSRWLRGETDLTGPAWILLRILDGEADTIVDGIKAGRTAESIPVSPVPVSPVRVIARAVVGQTPYDLEERMIPTTVRLWVRKCYGDPVPEGAIDFGEVWCLDLDSLKISV